ncbi:glycine cleavage system H protein 2, mitochondrial-like isoform X2 [Salvia miltiorrhiza]|uniref:glycine cleavage system H protein 2, mitochondrial-like isoform X2 n=1 Tax=Salvia miltiorrhiza TaxID=226208 RepID=UPI0025AC3E32|nr:glycine cleavage system H protein 2, mitochondrial-like isoform X2 [Salvia miltiorrhiza]
MASKLWATRLASYLKISAHNRGLATVVDDLKYAESHEWVKVEGNCVTIGISDHALDHLGHIIFVGLPDEGAEVKQGAVFGTVESMKSTSDINSPVSGKVVEVNTELTGSPGLVSYKDECKPLRKGMDGKGGDG